MKKYVTLLAVLLLTVILSACQESDTGAKNESNDDQIVLQFPTIFETENPAHTAIENFKAEVEEKSEGRIKIELYPNGELYTSDREIIEAIQMGTTDISLVGTPSLGSFDKNFYVLDLPYIFKDKHVVKDALQGELGDKLAESLENHNLKKISWGHESMRHILNNKRPINSPEDLNGIKLRVQEAEIQMDIFEAMGSNPSPLSFGEVYQALQQKVFDGMDSTISLIDSGKFYEVNKYLTLTNHTYSGTITLMNKELFDGLPKDLQEILLEAGKNMEEDYYVLIEESEQESLKKFKEEGLIEVNELTDEGFQEFVEAVQPVYEKYKDILDEGLLELAQSYNE